MSLAAFALAAAVAASPVTTAARLEATLSPAEITVGDRVRARVVLTVPDAVAPAEAPLLEVADRWGDARVLEKSLVSGLGSGSGRQGPPGEWVWDLELTAFRPGALELPPLTAVVANGGGPLLSATSDPITLEVRSVLPSEGEVEPRPPTAPGAWPGISPWWWILAALSALALLGLLYLWRRRSGSATRATAALRRPPLEALAREVGLLGELEDGEELHTRLSYAMREYLERKLRFPAVEHTTTEIRRDLATGPTPPDIGREIVEILRRCDDVKFARREAPLSTGRERADRALELARSLEQALQPREALEEAA